MNFLGSVNAGAKGADTLVAQRNPQKVPAPGSALGYDPRYAAVPGVGGPGNSVKGVFFWRQSSWPL
jgi:hypothetical protein